jgi:hypothetical protein
MDRTLLIPVAVAGLLSGCMGQEHKTRHLCGLVAVDLGPAIGAENWSEDERRGWGASEWVETYGRERLVKEMDLPEKATLGQIGWYCSAYTGRGQ